MIDDDALREEEEALREWIDSTRAVEDWDREEVAASSWTEVEERIGRSSAFRQWLVSRSAAGRAIGLLLFLCMIWSVGFVLLRRPDWEVLPKGRWWATMAMQWAALAALVGVWCRPVYRPPLSTGVRRLLVAGVVLAVGLPLLLPEAHRLHDASLEGRGDSFFSRAALCWTHGTVVAMVGACVAAFAGRGGLGGATALVTLLVGGICGLAFLETVCPIVWRAHLFVGHAGVVLVMLAVGWRLSRHRRRS